MIITDKKQVDDFMNKIFGDRKFDVKKIELKDKNNKVDIIINSKFCCSIDKNDVIDYMQKDTSK